MLLLVHMVLEMPNCLKYKAFHVSWFCCVNFYKERIGLHSVLTAICLGTGCIMISLSVEQSSVHILRYWTYDAASNDKGKEHAKVSNELSHYLLFNYTLSNINKLSILSLNKLLNFCTYSIDWNTEYIYTCNSITCLRVILRYSVSWSQKIYIKSTL